MKSIVRQMRGPGENLGLKKPRKGYIPKPKPYAPSKAMKQAMSMETSSLLPKGSTGKTRAPRKGGKVSSNLI